jgi:hypothetical protein
MKNKLFAYILLIPLMFVACLADAQSGKVPPFKMLQPDGKVFKAEDLPIGKPIIIIYFSKECEDCQQLTDKILNRIDDFKKVSIAMITYLSVESVSKFVMKNGLNKYPNIYIGTEGNYLFVLNYYKINKFPFLALYTKNGDLVKMYHDYEVDLDDLLSRLMNL